MSNFVVEKLLRAPHIATRKGTSEPLTVLFSLLSRADNSPLETRRVGDGHALNVFGSLMADPDYDPSSVGFDSDANVSFEHWGEYWRKVHGVRFTHVEEPDDVSLERLLRYDQLHRFAPGPTSSDAPPYRAPADASGKLWPRVIGHIPPYHRPRWDGVAYLNFATREDIAAVFANERVRTKILPEDQAMFRDIAPVLARQQVIIPSETGNEAITLVKLHARKGDETRETFQQWWLDEHAEHVTAELRAGKLVKRYVQLHNIGGTAADEPFYHPQATQIDGVSLLGFASLSDLEDFLASPANASIVQHESLKIDHATSEYWTTIDMLIVNRVRQEIRSE
ncbi:EthD domain-containing protein [Paraburkholderia bannensis]|uniref:EthD domain-containing protein n=1 Tax=Paraburkholderia bannensis TaxID=765414 RepID=UPI002AB64C8D|nr:EthD domain-containing protein [Paraburkholderia bannensis]